MRRLLDGQFDECDLTMRELEIIERSIMKSLMAIYHGRIQYPVDRSTGEQHPRHRSPHDGEIRLNRTLSKSGIAQEKRRSGNATASVPSECFRQHRPHLFRLSAPSTFGCPDVHPIGAT